MYERILVPLDGSETAEAALAYVALLPSERVRLLAVECDRARSHRGVHGRARLQGVSGGGRRTPARARPGCRHARGLRQPSRADSRARGRG